jgi:hypothetical protein
MSPKVTVEFEGKSVRRRGAGSWIRSLAAASATVWTLGLVGMFAPAPASGATSDDEAVVSVEVGASDVAAASSVTGRGVHTKGALSPDGSRRAPETLREDGAGNLVSVHPNQLSPLIPGFAVLDNPAANFPAGSFYPYDLHIYTVTGQLVTLAQAKVVTSGQTHNIYINEPPSHWGNPTIFQHHFYSSELIHVLDQYTGSTQDGRYQVGRSARVTYPVSSTPLMDGTDIAAIVHAVAAQFGTGYGHIYHVFLPKGVDECLAPGQCFSPDNPSTWVFCGYHSNVTFSDIGHVLYTIEPYPDVFSVINGIRHYSCDVGQSNHTNTTPTPNGVLVDSLSGVVSHETSETITDPDTGNFGWYSFNSGYEIGDVCENPYFAYVPYEVSGKLYYIQPEYSDDFHACVTVPHAAPSESDD